MIEVDLEIKNGRVITADGEFRGSVYIKAGKIAGLGASRTAGSRTVWTPPVLWSCPGCLNPTRI